MKVSFPPPLDMSPERAYIVRSMVRPVVQFLSATININHGRNYALIIIGGSPKFVHVTKKPYLKLGVVI